MNDHISAGAVKVIELIGVSDKSFDDAVQQVVVKASETISGITGVEVLKQSRVSRKERSNSTGQAYEWHSL